MGVRAVILVIVCSACAKPLAQVACVDALPSQHRAPPQVPIPSALGVVTDSPKAATVAETRRAFYFVESRSIGNWRCGTAEPYVRLPFEHHHERDVPASPNDPEIAVPIRRVVGPLALDGELASARVLVQRCYRKARRFDIATPSLTFTLLERSAQPLLVARVEPRDAPLALTTCIADVLIHEIVNPVGATEPMMVTTSVD